MKNIMFYASVLFAISVSRAELLTNLDFSNWIDPTRPDGWVVEDTTRAPVARSSNPVLSAPYSARITRMVAGTGNNYGLNQLVPVIPNQTYTISAWYLNSSTQARGGIGVSWYTPETTFISTTGITYSDTTITTWQRVSRVVTAPANAGFARTLFRVYGFATSQPGNTVYIDDASFSAGTALVESQSPTPHKPSVIIARPNPAADRIFFHAGTTTPATIEIFNMTGNLVQKLLVPAGGTTVWNATDHAGNRLPAGIYFAQTTGTKGRSEITKLVLKPLE